MSPIDFHPSPAKLRQFGFCGALFGLVMGVIAFFRHGAADHRATTAWLAIAVAMLALALIRPSLLRYLFIGMSVVTFPIGWVVSYALTAAIYFGAITPIALFFRACKRDHLHLRRERRESYWERRPDAPPTQQYFRQS